MANRNAQRIEKLEGIEKDIVKLMSLAESAVRELCKSNPSSETVEYTTKDFVKTLDGIDKCLSEQIQYLTQVSTIQPHEGSVYGAEKDYELSCLQLVLARERLQKPQSASSQNSTRRDQFHAGRTVTIPTIPTSSLPSSLPPSRPS